jgi:NAD(P)H-hydrate epimerase
LALDIPSGVDGVTGVACDGAVRADVTLTFGALKPGMIFGDGPDHCGEVIVDEIGLVIDEAESWLVEESDLVNVLGRRAHNAHKWQRGVVLVAGSAGMPGAAKLCSLAALRAGASMLRVGAPGVAPGEFGVTEAVALSLPSQGVAHALEDELHRAKAIIIGPGLGSDPHVVAEVRELVSSVGIAMVLDADALNALGEIDDKTPSLFSHNDCVVLTPHEGEFRRLTGHPPGADRVSSVREFARNAHAVVLLKGATTVVVGPTGPALLVNSGTSALATAGTGDVLSGVIGAFLARGLVPLEAAAFAAYLHGRAGALASQEGLIASDLPALIANVIESESHYAEPRIRAIDG